MAQDLGDHLVLGDERDDLHLPATRTRQRIDLVDLRDHSRPAPPQAASLRRRRRRRLFTTLQAQFLATGATPRHRRVRAVSTTNPAEPEPKRHLDGDRGSAGSAVSDWRLAISSGRGLSRTGPGPGSRPRPPAARSRPRRRRSLRKTPPPESARKRHDRSMLRRLMSSFASHIRSTQGISGYVARYIAAIWATTRTSRGGVESRFLHRPNRPDAVSCPRPWGRLRTAVDAQPPQGSWRGFRGSLFP